MNLIPDVLGYELKDALTILESCSYQVTIIQSLSPKNDKCGNARVIRTRNICNNKVEIIISYF